MRDLLIGSRGQEHSWELYDHRRELQAMAQTSVKSMQSKRFDNPFVLQNLYGKGFSPQSTTGQKDKQIFLLGLHNSGLGCLWRLLCIEIDYQALVHFSYQASSAVRLLARIAAATGHCLA